MCAPAPRADWWCPWSTAISFSREVGHGREARSDRRRATTTTELWRRELHRHRLRPSTTLAPPWRHALNRRGRQQRQAYGDYLFAEDRDGMVTILRCRAGRRGQRRIPLQKLWQQLTEASPSHGRRGTVPQLRLRSVRHGAPAAGRHHGETGDVSPIRKPICILRHLRYLLRIRRRLRPRVRKGR